jgi:hypothetical protein
MTVESGGTTLAYAHPGEQPVLPVRWALHGLAVFAVATLAERACIWVMFLAPPRSWPLGLSGRDVIDYVLPPLAAAGLLWVVLRERRRATPVLTRTLVALCAIQFVLAVLSIVYWSATVLPRVWSSRATGGGHDAVVWEAELFYLRLLPVALPLMIAFFAHRGLPTPRGAAAALTAWSIAAWTCAASATASLWHWRGWGALSANILGYTTTPAWTIVLIPVVLVGVVFWVGAIPARLRYVVCSVAAISWFAAALLRAWYDERMVSVRDGRFAELTHLANLAGIVAELIADLILWQIAPMALLLFLARRRPV